MKMHFTKDTQTTDKYMTKLPLSVVIREMQDNITVRQPFPPARTAETVTIPNALRAVDQSTPILRWWEFGRVPWLLRFVQQLLIK